MKKIKGVALLWTLLISIVLLIISGTMVNFIVKDSKFTVNIEDSVKSYALAKSGLDWGNWYKEQFKVNGIYSFNVPIGSDNGSILVNISDTNITSLANVNGVERKLKSTIKEKISTSIDNTTNLNPNDDDFTLQFDFWVTGINSDVEFGLRENDGTPALRMVISSTGEIRLKAGDVLSDTVYNLNSTPTKSEPYNFRAEIKYTEGTAASLKISEKVIIDGNETFVSRGSRSIAITDPNQLGNLDTIHSIPAYSYQKEPWATSDSEGMLFFLGSGSTAVYVDKVLIVK